MTSGVSNEPRGQLLVADGRNLWFYDKELAQVTVKPVESALSATPIVLLSGSNAQLHASFDISAGPFHDGLDWVEVRPRAAESDFSHAELGFSGDKLVRMIVKDRLGQTVQLDFPHSVRNPHIDAGGAEVHAAGRRRRHRHAAELARKRLTPWPVAITRNNHCSETSARAICGRSPIACGRIVWKSSSGSRICSHRVSRCTRRSSPVSPIR